MSPELSVSKNVLTICSLRLAASGIGPPPVGIILAHNWVSQSEGEQQRLIRGARFGRNHATRAQICYYRHLHRTGGAKCDD